jgi:hypothetical protein
VVTSKKSVDVNNNDLNDSCTRLRGFSLADENELDVSREIALKSELLSEQVNNALNWSKSVLEKTSPIRRQFFTDEAFAGLPSLSTQIGLNDFSLNSHKESPHLVSPNSPIIITSPVTSKVQREAFSHALAPTPTQALAHTFTQALAPTSTQALAPTSTQALAPTSTQALAPTSTQALAPTSTQALAPTSTQALAPTSTQALAPTSTQALAPTSTQALAPTSTQALAPTSTQALAPTSTQALAPTSTQALAPTSTQALAPTSTQAQTDNNRLFTLPPVPLFGKPTEKLNKSPSVQNDQPKKINNIHASQQPPVPHSVSNPLLIQQQLPIQSKPHVNKNNRNAHPKPLFTPSEVALLRVSDKIDTLANQLVIDKIQNKSNCSLNVSYSSSPSNETPNKISGIEIRIFNNIFKRNLEKKFTLEVLKAHPLEHFIINSPQELKEIIGKFILRAHKKTIL